ncbi:putative 2-hydroxyacid dehydrogenase [Shewanella sp. P1-14-1]|uniref:D-2-hydroxyacid dehydrogenase n=1 Tax=Shewanella sp. P1-14-1 TaxID=1723761 RepID=UPI0006D65EA4|nr:D-2-hydroxyacid dehydrogenase [Shewanella sp. P1-14-1]KPZ71129.1 putative 2-hydroxyacid dehydrogenase [Shewanella sp. P1-14-1]
MKIVVLDGYTLNPGDLSWDALSQFGDIEVFEHTEHDQIISRSRDADIILTNKAVITNKVIEHCPKLKYIGVTATGTNVVDMTAASSRNIVVTNVPAYGPDAVAQMVFALILQHSQQVSLHDEAVKQGQWSNARDFCFTLSPLMSLKGKTIGIVGYGDIGQQVATLALAFNMNVIITSGSKKTNLPLNVSWQPLEVLLTQADIVSLHCPLNETTDKLINSQSLGLLKPGALLVNTARGGLIDEDALALALNQHKLFAAVDVLSTEPPAKDNPLLSANNIVITPHIAWATIEARQNLLTIAANNIEQFLQGKPCHQVN